MRRETHTIEESKRLNSMRGPMVIISASGMAETGRILHHLKNNIENPLNTILIVSWQAPHTLGRRLAETAIRAAERLGQKAVIYMPKGSAPSRVTAIRSHGATVEVTDLNYDDAVRLACRKAEENDWYVVQDTAWEGYTEVPLWIMQGYLTMCSETVDQLRAEDAYPTHIFVQAGVGALAGAVVGYLAQVYQEPRPKFIIMEPNNAACIFASVAAGDGRPHAVTGDLDTIMVGLACGEPNPLSWEILRDIPSGYVSCDNFTAANGMRILANPVGSDASVEGGESGAVGIGLMDLLANNTDLEALKDKLEIGRDSTLLCFNTEGATDPLNYQEIIWHGKYPSVC
mgnify:CR=1 FL=1